MRFQTLTILMVVLVVGACGDGGPTQAQLQGEQIDTIYKSNVVAVKACFDRIEQMPEANVVRKHFPSGPPSLAMQANPAKASPAEVRALYAIHNAFGPCRGLRIRMSNAISSDYAAPHLESYRTIDAIYAGMVQGRMTWGEFSSAWYAMTTRLDAQIAAANASIEQRMSSAHAAELRRREQRTDAVLGAIGAGLSGAAEQYQQQQQIKQQQINATLSQPRNVNCTRIGGIVNCTAY